MAKKRKLNSTNPKYMKVEEAKPVEKVLIRTVRGVKVYAVFNL